MKESGRPRVRLRRWRLTCRRCGRGLLEGLTKPEVDAIAALMDRNQEIIHPCEQADRFAFEEVTVR